MSGCSFPRGFGGGGSGLGEVAGGWRRVGGAGTGRRGTGGWREGQCHRLPRAWGRRVPPDPKLRFMARWANSKVWAVLRRGGESWPSGFAPGEGGVRRGSFGRKG